MGNSVRMEGITLSVVDVKLSIEYYRDKLGFVLEWDAAPQFALLRIGGPQGGTIGLLASALGAKDGAQAMSRAQARAIHIEISTDNLDGLHDELVAKGIEIDVPPHDEPWERSMTLYDPDGYSVEFSQGRRGKQR